jgi:hypothetical protein
MHKRPLEPEVVEPKVVERERVETDVSGAGSKRMYRKRDVEPESSPGVA